MMGTSEMGQSLARVKNRLFAGLFLSLRRSGITRRFSADLLQPRAQPLRPCCRPVSTFNFPFLHLGVLMDHGLALLVQDVLLPPPAIIAGRSLATLVERAKARLHGSAYQPLRTISCEFT